jgi:hypothetical protein
MDIIEIAHGRKPLKLEDRLLKAIVNIDEAFTKMPTVELDKPLSLTGREYLANQKCLLQALLANEYW